MSNRALRKLQAGSGLSRKEEEEGEEEEELEVVRKGGAASGGFNAFLLVSRLVPYLDLLYRYRTRHCEGVTVTF